MKILSLHIDGFGKFHDRDISFEDGLNVVSVSYTHLTLPTIYSV